MSDEEREVDYTTVVDEDFWSLAAYRHEKRNRHDVVTSTRLHIINAFIALAIILSFIGFIVFPQIFIPGSALLAGCLIGAQALAGFAILATIVKVLSHIIERGDWKKTLRAILFAPIDFFEKHRVGATLLTLGFIAIAVVLILSGTGVITVPFLTVFATNSFSLELAEIVMGLLSDIVIVATAAMLVYLPTLITKIVDYLKAKSVDVVDISKVGHTLYYCKTFPKALENPAQTDEEIIQQSSYKDSYIVVGEKCKSIMYITNDLKKREIKVDDDFSKVFSTINETHHHVPTMLLSVEEDDQLKSHFLNLPPKGEEASDSECTIV